MYAYIYAHMVPLQSPLDMLTGVQLYRVLCDLVYWYSTIVTSCCGLYIYLDTLYCICDPLALNRPTGIQFYKVLSVSCLLVFDYEPHPVWTFLYI